MDGFRSRVCESGFVVDQIILLASHVPCQMTNCPYLVEWNVPTMDPLFSGYDCGFVGLQKKNPCIN